MTDASTRELVVASPEEVSEVQFDAEMENEIGRICGRYPKEGAALLPVLWLCQGKWGWISPGIRRWVTSPQAPDVGMLRLKMKTEPVSG